MDLGCMSLWETETPEGTWFLWVDFKRRRSSVLVRRGFC